ncbi:MAG: guanylate kinase [Clostridia bacterium]|nr:guanylate kinase [Clostridia bacterium]
MRGLAIVISGHSGVGKSTVIDLVREALPDMQFSVSCTTRKPRNYEVDGVNYYFVSEEQFDKYIEEDAFVEYTRTFTYHYGTLKSEIDRRLEMGLDILLELNVVGAENIKKLYPDDCVTIFIDPPSIDELKARLIGRKSETPETLARRLAEIDFERSRMGGYDHLVVNEVARDCADKILDIIKAEHQKKADKE